MPGKPTSSWFETGNAPTVRSWEVYFAALVGSPDAIKLHPEDHASYLWVGKDELHKVVNPGQGTDDPEYVALQKAFVLFEGGSPDFAS